MLRRLARLHRDERGHAALGVADLAAAAGAVLLAAGAAANEDVITIIGGIVLALGVFGSGIMRHTQIDYDLWRRLARLEGKNDGGD